ncbi:alpha/beta hydrolase family protein [Sphingomonas adhaesiva]|uniref:alpha/beta hydrolase family protein n=1 Tax=Sphingomonas adhaesiva TaxID=28212 RepID=UPI002FF93E5E
MNGRRGAVAVLSLLWGTTAIAGAPGDLATRFGAREMVAAISLAPDGKHIVYVTPTGTRGSAAVVVDLDSGKLSGIRLSEGDRMTPVNCGWASGARLICKFYGIDDYVGMRISYTRTLGFDADGTHALYLGRNARGGDRLNQFDGNVIDWRMGDGKVLMTRDFVPQSTSTGSHMGGDARDGMGVELVDAATGKAQLIERPDPDATDFYADGQGVIRMKAVMPTSGTGQLKGDVIYSYRPTGETGWKLFSRSLRDDKDSLDPLGVDGTRNMAFATKRLNGRLALYGVALDGSMKSELVSSNPDVDVDSIVRIGRRGRIIGATYVTDRRQIDYFDPEYRKLAAALARALPKTPLIRLMSATADESQLLVFAGSDVDPGSYYLYTKANRHLEQLVRARPTLEDVALGQMRAVRFPAADGTMIPAYLTLPPGGATKGLPAIVMPHGGPAYRDEWGFDWLVQFFAASGYAVLQPQFRGSTGYGDAWFANNGFRSWQLAIGDVGDAGRWLVKEGIADPAKLGIVGWSYGGYAALQSNVVDPDLFKAVVAIAPVTDLGRTKDEAEGFTNRELVQRQIGSGENVANGSPARHAERFKAPVLLFHGDTDVNVGVGQSRLMDKRLRAAGKESTLIVFPKLDHQLDDSAVRTEMLAKSDAFLRKAFGM